VERPHRSEDNDLDASVEWSRIDQVALPAR
jgi:hypothetical protein